METQSPTTQPNSFKIVVLICLVLLVGVIGWLLYRVENVADKQAKTNTIIKEDNSGVSSADTGWNTVVKSGSGGFELTLPDGWGPITRDLNSDYIILPGMLQPTVQKGKEVKVNDVEGHGSDSPSLFSVVLAKKDAVAAPRGEASEFRIGKAEGEIIGKKYVYTFPQDDLDGIGIVRFKGDRVYEYVLPFGDKELHVYYNVYGSDPRNLSVTVDEIVRTAMPVKE